MVEHFTDIIHQHYHPSSFFFIWIFPLPPSALYLWQITVSSPTIKSTVAPRDCGSCYPDSKVEETPGHSRTVQEPLEIQSRSISLSSATVVPPENLNEKHFAAEFADLARSARFLVVFFKAGQSDSQHLAFAQASEPEWRRRCTDRISLT